MSFDDDFALQVLREMYLTFGVDGAVARRDGPAVPVRIIVNRGQERIGEFNQVVGRVTTVVFMADQWRPAAGDVVSWSDRLGAHHKKVEGPRSDDGLEIEVVLHA